MMRYLSVFSGIEAATVAWKDLGWELAGVSEIEPFPCSVLKHHYPDVTNYGDINNYKEWNIERGSIDLIVGGSPCQAFSTAGLRRGLEDPRGNLALVYLGLIDHLRPEWIVWENVPGVLSSNGGRDFGTFLGSLSELRYGWSYRCINSEYLGVPQRRRRVYLVGHSSGDWRRAAEVLFEPESMCGNPKKSRTKRARIAPTPKRGTVVGDCEGRVGNPTLTCSNLANINNQSFLVGEKVVPFRKSSRAQTKDGLETWVEDEVSNTVNCFDVGDVRSTNISVHLYENHPNDSRIKELHDVCSTVTSRWGTGGGNVPLVGHEKKVVYSVREDAKANNFSVNERTVMNALQAMRPAVSSHHAQNFIVHRPTDNIANTIGCGNHLTPEDVVIVEPLAFEPGSVARNAGPAGLSEQCPTLRANMGDNQPAVVYTMPIQDTRDVQKSQNGLGVGDDGSPAYTVDTHATQGVAQVSQYNMVVRRLTPVESLRLQGFPDDYLDVLHNNRVPGDNAVFKAIGNSMATPVVAWLGKRINSAMERHPK